MSTGSQNKRREGPASSGPSLLYENLTDGGLSIKGNPAWKGSLALLFLGGAASLFYKYGQYEEKPYIQVGIGLGLIGAALMVWFAITG